MENKLVTNLINEIEDINKDVFTKKEIITILKKLNDDVRLPIVESNGIVVDPETFTVNLEGNVMTVPNRIFHLLHYFISNKNKNLTRDQIIKNVWGTEICVVDRTIDVHICKLRNMLPQNYIENIKRIGYRWNEK